MHKSDKFKQNIHPKLQNTNLLNSERTKGE